MTYWNETIIAFGSRQQSIRTTHDIKMFLFIFPHFWFCAYLPSLQQPQSRENKEDEKEWYFLNENSKNIPINRRNVTTTLCRTRMCCVLFCLVFSRLFWDFIHVWKATGEMTISTKKRVSHQPSSFYIHQLLSDGASLFFLLESDPFQPLIIFRFWEWTSLFPSSVYRLSNETHMKW